MSRVDGEESALLLRMGTSEPTDDAIAAREEFWSINASLGDDELRALLASSVGWIEALDRGGELERLRSGACRPLASSAKQDTDVISSLADGESELGPPRTDAPPSSWSRGGLGLAWFDPRLADAGCERAYRALRALAVTRAWLSANVDDVGVLETFQDAVERVRGGARARRTTRSRGRSPDTCSNSTRCPSTAKEPAGAFT